MKRAIVGRQAVIQLVGPNGPQDVGKWDDFTASDELETEEHKPNDGTTEYLVTGYKYSGTLKRGMYDGGLVDILLAEQHPGQTDPSRYILVLTYKYNDGSTRMDIYKEVLLTRRGESVPRAMVTEDLDWVAEDKEKLA